MGDRSNPPRFGRRRRIWRSRGGAVGAVGAVGAGGSRTAPTFEIGGVPTRAFELKAWRCQLFVEFGSSANRAIGQRGVAHFLQNILGMAAGVAFVGVNGHVKSL